MSNIVERLRKAANDPHTVSTTVRNGVRHWEIGCDKELLLEAADEIIRLRVDLYYDYLELKEELEAERKKHEKLAKENKELRDERDVDHDANIALYSALEEERKKHEWVSVKDRLPKETGLYVVTVFNEIENEVFVSDSVFYEGRWVERNGDGLEITHWMPFPDPPKGE